MKRKRILLAEDDADDRAFFCEFLSDRQDIIILPVAENGEDLLEYLHNIPDNEELPDIIILDQNMPKLNGLQTLQALKSSNRFVHIITMVYSTYPDDNLLKKSKDLGAAMVMVKPATPGEYNEIIDALFRMSQDQ